MGRIEIKDLIKDFGDCSKCKHIDIETDWDEETIHIKCKKNLPVSMTVGRCAEYETDKHVIECH